MLPKVYVSLTKKQFLFIQENVHASKSFWKIYPLKLAKKNKFLCKLIGCELDEGAE